LGQHDVVFCEASTRRVEQRLLVGGALGDDAITRLADNDVGGSDDVFVLEAVRQAVWWGYDCEPKRRKLIVGNCETVAAKGRRDQGLAAVDRQYSTRVCRIAR